MKKLYVMAMCVFGGMAIGQTRTTTKPTLITWEYPSETVDIYRSDSLLAQNIPCGISKQVWLHDYPVGEYRFVFKSRNRITEEKTVKITNR